jgi:hypothetical protein
MISVWAASQSSFPAEFASPRSYELFMRPRIAGAFIASASDRTQKLSRLFMNSVWNAGNETTPLPAMC